MSVCKMVLELDELDYAAVVRVIAERESGGELPDGGGNLNGRTIAEICRGYDEMLNMPLPGD